MPRNSGQAKSQSKVAAVDRRQVHGGSPNERLAQIIEETDWNEMTRRLLSYARLRQTHYGLRDTAKTPENYVNQAIFDTLEDQRHFPAELGVPLFRFLARVVDSLISHDAIPSRITRTIKPASGSSHVSAEEARAAARLVYRDEKTGRSVLLDSERSGRSERRAKVQSYPRDVAKRAKGSERRRYFLSNGTIRPPSATASSGTSSPCA